MASHSRWPSRLRSDVGTRRHPTSRSPDHRRLSTVRRRHVRLHSTLSHHGLLAVAAVVAPLLACQPDASPVGPSGSLAASRNGVSSTEGLASPGWQGTAAHLVMQANLSPTVATRAYSLVGVAQYLAVQQAEGVTHARHGDDDGDDETGGGGRSGPESDRGAVAGASAAGLSHPFSTPAPALEELVTTHGKAAFAPPAHAV